MIRRRWLATAVAAMTALAATASMAGATHEDVIPEPIPPSGVSVGVELVADGFTTPLWAINPPGDGRRIVVVDQIGEVWAITLQPSGNPNEPERVLMLDVGADGLGLLVELGAFGPGTFDERGLLGLAFHPGYPINGLLYTYTSEPVSGAADFSTMPVGVEAHHQTVIREWRVPNPRNPNSVVDPASTRVLMTIDQPQFNHNAGALNFGPDRKLYIAVGDGGSADDQGDGHAEGGNGQDLSDGNVLGKILRIDPRGSNSANGQYGVPADNPFVGVQGADEIWAYGFRNPFRFSFDRLGKRLIAADVGQNDIEEVDVVVRGGNYGWPVKEGSWLFDMAGDDPGFTTVFSPGDPPGMIDPIAEYDHDEGISISGGFVYRGTAIPELRGSYVFGDFATDFITPSGRLFHLDANGDIAELMALDLYVMGFGQDRRGDVYVGTSEEFAPVGETGKLWKIVPGS